MSKDDFDHLTIRRTRYGTARGDAIERKMLDAIDDTGSYRTRILMHPDGTQTRMKTKGGMPEFITDEVSQQGQESVCSIAMDSGVVDLQSASLIGTLAGDHDSGFLLRTDYVAAHVAASDDPESTGPILGKIHPPSFKGTAPENGAVAKSFDASSGHDPYDKKRIAVLCPPSVFTGKMRMYVQSLYGRHDHGEMFMLPPGAGISAPSVYFDYTKTFGTEEDPGAGSVLFDTNCGVFTDLSTYKHYLISIAASRIKIYRLKATSCGEKLRKKLIDDSVSAGDKEKIEAYILSQSHPDMTEGSMVELTDLDIHASSMGYGWHFNWDGNKADIVVNYISSASGGGLENTSIHYRITFSINSFGMWSAENSVVEGPVLWKSLRHGHPITYPAWDKLALEKFGAHTGPLPYGDAPFYVFYTKNELNVCRYSATTGSHAKQGVVREPYYYAPNTRDAIGTDAINHRTREAYTGDTVSFSCGANSVSYGISTYTENVETRTPPSPGSIKSKSSLGPSVGYLTGVSDWPVEQPTYIALTSIGDSYWGTIDVAQGVYGGWATESFGPYPSYRGDYGELSVYATVEVFASSISKQASFIAAIPFYDAEAILLYGEQTTTEHEVGTSSYGGVDAFGFNGLWETSSIVATYGKMTSTSSIGISDEVSSAIDRTVVTTSNQSILVCNYGEVSNIDMPGKTGFWEAKDIVSQTYPTLTSAAGEAVKANANGVYSGMDEITNETSFVGWA